MNWTALGAIGELVGAIAVLVTLIYFAIQIRNIQGASSANSLSVTDQAETLGATRSM